MDNIKIMLDIGNMNNKKNISHNITNKFILDIYNNELDIINMFIDVILNDYNAFYNNKIEIQSMILYSNKLLLSYISTTTLDYIDNHKKAYEFMFLSTITCFWILYKFIINDNCINANLLGSYVYYTSSEILKKEIDILNTINYNIYPIVINIEQASL